MTSGINTKKIRLPIRVVMAWPLFALWIFFLWVLVVLDIHPAVPAFAVPVVLLALAGLLIPGRAGDLIKKINKAYILVIALVTMAVLFHISFLTGPVFTAIAAIAAAAIGFANMPSKTRAFLAATFSVCI